jgi:serine/threonine-protein kinase HipA
VQPKILVRDEKAFAEMEPTEHRLWQSYKGATHIVKLWEANECPQLAGKSRCCFQRLSRLALRHLTLRQSA